MRGLGTIINTATVLAGGGLGLLIGNRIPDRSSNHPGLGGDGVYFSAHPSSCHLGLDFPGFEPVASSEIATMLTHVIAQGLTALPPVFARITPFSLELYSLTSFSWPRHHRTFGAPQASRDAYCARSLAALKFSATRP